VKVPPRRSMPDVLKATPGANLLEGGHFDVSRILETSKMKGG
jgi:hypothetical protein